MPNVYSTTGMSKVIGTGLLFSHSSKSSLNFQEANPTRITSSGTDRLTSNSHRFFNVSILIFFLLGKKMSFGVTKCESKYVALC